MAETRKVAFFSVYHKSNNLVLIAREFVQRYDILATTGTATYLKSSGINNVVDVAEYVGPALLEHGVVTLHSGIHVALRAPYTPEGDAAIAKFDIPRIDALCVEFYPPDVNRIDVGGPALLTSALNGRRPVVYVRSDDRIVPPSQRRSFAEMDLSDIRNRRYVLAILRGYYTALHEEAEIALGRE